MSERSGKQERAPSRDGRPALFDVPLPDGGADAAGARRRKRTLGSPGPSSDVTRTRGLAAGAAASAVVAVIAAAVLSPPGGLSSVGPMALPHARAGLTCASCHEAPFLAPRTAGDPAGSSRVGDAACEGCHGPHPSARPGHAALECASCHLIHRGDQGVAFAPGKPALRFGPGAEAELPSSPFHPERPATVPVVTLRSCEGCHDAASSTDPIARCVFPDQVLLERDRPIVCFDEHRPPLEDGRPRAAGGAVCEAQHGADRSAAWEAARDAVRLEPEAPSGFSMVPWLAAGFGLGAGALMTLALRLGHAARARSARSRPLGPEPAPGAPPARARRLPVVDASTCLGCNACVDACPYDVLAIERYVAVVARPDACCGLALCEQRCPNGSLRTVEGGAAPAGPALSPDLESEEVPGLYLAGDVTGAPLIKSAIAQGARAADAIAASLGRRAAGGPPRARPAPGRGRGGGGRETFDLLIVGAGPAGISAALRARELGLDAVAVEQGSVAQSIRSFPRGKLIVDQPLDLPSVGSLWLEESTKEELLAQWTLAVRKARLDVREETRVTGVRRARLEPERGAAFEVACAPAEGALFTLEARRVLLAIGQRGSPRRLPFPLTPEVEGKVHYHLSDARSFAGKRILVVGLGDVAMETAVALARQPGTRVTVIHRGDDFRRGSARNIDALRKLVHAGRIDLRFRTELRALRPAEAELSSPRGPERTAYDAAFVMIGSIPPLDLLRQAGVSVPDPRENNHQ